MKRPILVLSIGLFLYYFNKYIGCLKGVFNLRQLFYILKPKIYHINKNKSIKTHKILFIYKNILT